jgi:hypothetical protein
MEAISLQKVIKESSIIDYSTVMPGGDERYREPADGTVHNGDVHQGTFLVPLSIANVIIHRGVLDEGITT